MRVAGRIGMAVVLMATTAWGAVKTGPEVGEKVPAFEVSDTDGNVRSFENLRGPNGLVLLFVRSADWWPYCKTQLVQLGEQAAEFRKRGYGVAGLTYDSPEILRYFRDRFKLQYTLLSDQESEVIRAFDILNDEIPKGHEWYGVPHPGMYLIDAGGVVKEKFFEDSVVERYTAATALHAIDAEDGMVSGWAESEHLKITVSASDYNIRPGNRVTLTLNVQLKEGLHVYAPEVKGGYKPVRWKIQPSPAWKVHDAEFPDSKTLHLPAIDETVPVYEGAFVVSRDITVGQIPELVKVVNGQGDMAVKGSFRYQACDDKECYRPREIELEWSLHALMHDPQRVPEEIRR